MIKEIYTAALGMFPQQTKLEVTANNIANASTPGFKRESVFERNLIDARANLYNVQGDAEQNDPPIGSYTDFAQGSFTKTDNPLDIAIDNKDGFFVLNDEQGNEYLTKSGKFKITTDGLVVSSDNKMLMGSNGPVNLQNALINSKEGYEESKNINLVITQNGEIQLNQTFLGNLRIVEVNNPQSLERVSNSCFVTTEGTDFRNLEKEEISLKQGWIEGSNVDIIKEMVEMIEVQRMFELGSKVIHTNNETLEISLRMSKFY